ncbi:unnamed protein product [Rotaria sordida]|uniref:Btz domain-containing protein n=1 Tax=Rotaria sordida TaxID=392033 RepID=A0A818N8G8_9BILA|nr:unnamed protein product [Rotaria sordida]
MTESNPVSTVNEDISSTNNAEQQETTTATPTPPTTVTNDESNQEVTVVPTKDTTNENVIDENKTEEKEQILESSSNINTKESESQSKEPSSERQFQDAEKATENDAEVYDDNDSEYEDVDDEEGEEIDEKNHTQVLNKSATEEDDERINIKPRRLPKKRDENEHSEGYEDDDNQNVPNTNAKSNRRGEKKSDKNLEPLDDDNDARNPAYIPRKGKFYEHDDRTNDQSEQPKQETTRNRNRPYRDSDAKWQHDLYYDYEDESHSHQSNYRGQRRGGRFSRGSGGDRGGRDDRNQLHLNDYIPPAQRGRGGGYRQQQLYYDEDNDYRRRAPPYVKSRNDHMNNFEFEDYNRSSYNNNRGRGNRNNYVEQQAPPRRQRRDFEQYQTEEQSIPPRRNQQYTNTTEQTVHRERNFTNTQFQQQRNIPKNNNRDDQKRSTGQTYEVNQDDNNNKNRNQRRENNEPPRRQGRNNRNQQQQQNEPSTTNSNLSAEAPSFERSKRYSNMRSNVSNSGPQQQQQQPPPVQQPQIPMQSYQDQRTGYYDQNHWQQAPPPPTTYLPQQQQMIPAQMYHPQQPIPPQPYYVAPPYQQAAQYVPINYPQGSIPPQVRYIGGEHQRRLLKYLLDENNHNPLERPVYNDSHTLTVTMNMALQQIIDFDEKNEILAISGWIVLTWHDYSLQWKPEEFGNIQAIRIPSTRVWIPDILLYNSADLNFEGIMKTNLVVQSNGINLTTDHSEGQLDAYVQSGEWDLESFIVVRKAVVYECCPTVYPFILFTIRIRRRTLYYVVNVVVPCVLISFMTVLGFLLPPDSGEKLTLQITILLSIVMFSLLIAGIIPASSTALPTIVMYFTTVMCICSMSVFATVMVLVLHHRNAKNHTMPMWIHLYINQYLAWLLCMKRPGHDLSWKGIRHRCSLKNNSIHNHKYSSTPLLENSSKSLLANIMNIDKQTYQKSNNQLLIPIMNHVENSSHNHDTNDVLIPYDMNIYRSDLRMIMYELKFLSDYIRKEEEDDDISQDWKFSAMVIDRLCLVLFSIMTTIFSYVTLFSAPNFLKLR